MLLNGLILRVSTKCLAAMRRAMRYISVCYNEKPSDRFQAVPRRYFWREACAKSHLFVHSFRPRAAREAVIELSHMYGLGGVAASRRLLANNRKYDNVIFSFQANSHLGQMKIASINRIISNRPEVIV
jgi:hypothetical protein